MGLGNILVLSQVTAYFVSFIVSFMLFIPVAVNVNEFGGNCLLYAEGKWVSEANSSVMELESVVWGPSSACGFNIFMGVILMLISMFYVVWESAYLIKDTDSSWLDAFVTAILSMVICLMLFASSLTLSVGFNSWCTLLTTPPSEILECEFGDYIQFTDKVSNLETRNFYTEMTLAQFAGWMLWLCWLLLTIFAFLKVFRYHQQETFTKSMNRERQRLLQSVGHQTPVVL
ncbi:transmembrane protein 179-like [Mizuhopecten yessoensis]|uniref:Transmembrane protein 179 n=1 Tax=Mizuhopecten yessoensis TaxID=6573 RepID=A0A210QNR5_MIZYE|nr:transmembrane protein 179-like [Mizuhopecten yessoensis]OWF50372.1 Transmembrane protein 179 [Mizuhopecten yessoensis]